MRFNRYVFVCTNERPAEHPRGSCAGRGSLAILEELKRLVKANNLQLDVRINKAGCMECCELGPTLLVHPDNVWYGKVQLDDCQEIVEQHLVGGKPVERLLADFSVYGKGPKT